jgi:hypothetical protein
MPRYDFLNTETGEVKEYTMSWKELDKFKEENPHLKQQINQLNMITNKDGAVLKKAGDGWKEVQDRIKSGMPPRLRGNIKTK